MMPFFGKTKVNAVAANCPLKGRIMVEVSAVRADDVQIRRLSDVPVKITAGTTRPGSQSTNAQGRVNFTGLVPGNYTVEIKPEGDLLQKYDFDAIDWDDAQAVAANAETTYLFSVPYYKVDITVKYRDNDSAVQALPYVLELQRGTKKGYEKNWTQYDQGTLNAQGHVFKNFVPRGHYRLSLKLLWAPVWSATPLVVGGDALTLSARVSGAAEGTAGSFEILDAHRLDRILHTLTAKVAARTKGSDDYEIQTSWKAKADDFGDWKGSHVVFRAKVGAASVLSDPVPVMLNETVKVADDGGRPIDGALTLHFASGASVTANSAGGKAEVVVPWGQNLSHVEFASQAGSRLKVEEKDQAAREFSLP